VAAALLVDREAELLGGRTARPVGDLHGEVNVPAVVGVPLSSLLIWVGAPVVTSLSPGGSCPAITDQVYGAKPPWKKKPCT